MNPAFHRQHGRRGALRIEVRPARHDHRHEKTPLFVRPLRREIERRLDVLGANPFDREKKAAQLVRVIGIAILLLERREQPRERAATALLRSRGVSSPRNLCHRRRVPASTLGGWKTSRILARKHRACLVTGSAAHDKTRRPCGSDRREDQDELDAGIHREMAAGITARSRASRGNAPVSEVSV